MNKNVLTVVLILVVLVAGGYLIFGRGSTKSAENKADNAATVNGVAIPKATYDTQLALMIDSLKSQGVDVVDEERLAQIKTQVLNDLISNELVNQGVTDANIKSTPEEIEAEFQAVLGQVGSAEGLKDELAKINLTETQLRENISKQLAIQKYLLQNIDTKSISVSDAEIAQFYADYSQTQKDAGQKSVPTLKELTEQIRQQIINNKQQALVTDFISSLRTKAKIEINI